MTLESRLENVWAGNQYEFSYYKDTETQPNLLHNLATTHFWFWTFQRDFCQAST